MTDALVVALIAGLASVISAGLNQGAEWLKSRKDHPYQELKQELELDQGKLKLQQESLNTLQQVLNEFPFLKEALSEWGYTMGYRGIKKPTGNPHFPVVLVERDKYGITLSWKPEDIQGHYYPDSK